MRCGGATFEIFLDQTALQDEFSIGATRDSLNLIRCRGKESLVNDAPIFNLNAYNPAEIQAAIETVGVK
jgi:hypothetical protein